MQAVITLALVSLLIASPLWAGTITFDFGAERIRTTTAAQDARLAAYVARLNIERAAQTPPLAAISIRAVPGRPAGRRRGHGHSPDG